MADENANRETRLDRIERIMALMASHHEQFRGHQQQLLRGLVLQKDAIDQLLRVTQELTRKMEARREFPLMN